MTSVELPPIVRKRVHPRLYSFLSPAERTDLTAVWKHVGNGKPTKAADWEAAFGSGDHSLQANASMFENASTAAAQFMRQFGEEDHVSAAHFLEYYNARAMAGVDVAAMLPRLRASCGLTVISTQKTDRTRNPAGALILPSAALADKPDSYVSDSSKETVVENLLQRFPVFDKATIERVLAHCEGHGGDAAAELQYLISEPSKGAVQMVMPRVSPSITLAASVSRGRLLLAHCMRLCTFVVSLLRCSL